MNQILDYGPGNNENDSGKSKKNKKYENNYNSGRKTSTSDKVVKVFAFLMIVLAIALIASGVLSILKNKKTETEQKSSEKIENQVVEAEILAELDDSTGKVKITVNSPVVISKLIYSWDQDHDSVVSGNKQTSLDCTTQDSAPYGEHVLHIQVLDEQNNKTTKDFTFNSTTGKDTTKPKIVLSITEDKKLLVSVTDDTSIDYVTYSWNQEDEITMRPDEEDSKEYEFELEIPEGKNTIVVYAIDGSDTPNVTTTSKVFEGVKNPEIICGFLDNEGKVLQVKCTHDNGIKSIYYTLNGQSYQWEAPEGEEPPKELTFTQESVPGRNEMFIKVTSVNDTVKEFKPVWDYGVADETGTESGEDDTSTETDTESGDDNTSTETDTESREENTSTNTDEEDE